MLMLTKGLQAFCKTTCGLLPPIPLTLKTITIKAGRCWKRERKIHCYGGGECIKESDLSKTWARTWLKWNNYSYKFLHGGALSIDKLEFHNGLQRYNNKSATLTLRMCTIWTRLA